MVLLPHLIRRYAILHLIAIALILTAEIGVHETDHLLVVLDIATTHLLSLQPKLSRTSKHLLRTLINSFYILQRDNILPRSRNPFPMLMLAHRLMSLTRKITIVNIRILIAWI